MRSRSCIFAYTLLVSVYLCVSYRISDGSGTVWKYLDDGTDLTFTDWKVGTFDDSTWPSGPSRLGYGYGNENTTTSFGSNAGSKQITTYFRRKFTVSAPIGNLTACVVGMVANSGGVMYVNGVEIARRNMGPQEIIKYSDTALVNLPTGDDTAIVYYWFSCDLLTLGSNVLSAEVHLFRTTSSFTLMAFDSSLLVTDELTLPEQIGRPYTQTVNKGEIELRWITNINSNTRIYYSGTLGAPLMLTTRSSSQNSTLHNLAVTSLSANTRYSYHTVINDANFPTQVVLSFNNRFLPVPSPVTTVAANTRFVVVGDAGTGTPAAISVGNAVRQYISNTNGLLSSIFSLGNAAYPSGTQSDFATTFLTSFGDITGIASLFPLFGSVDAISSDGDTESGPFFSLFRWAQLTSGVASGKKTYFSFDWSAIHVVVLDSMTADRSASGPMATWLTNNLNAVKTAGNAKWLVVLSHHSPYTSGVGNSDTLPNSAELRQNILPILESFGVDLWLSGHTRAYERSVLLNGFTGTSGTYNAASHAKNAGSGPYVKAPGLNANSGCVFTVIGSSGGVTETNTLTKPYMASTNKAKAGAVIIEATEFVLDVKFLAFDGSVPDQFQIQKHTVVSGVPSVSAAPDSPSSTQTMTATQAPAASASTSVSASASISASSTPSISRSTSRSTSVSASVTPTISVTASLSVSATSSTSVSATMSATRTPTVSLSTTQSVSGTPAASVSVSESSTSSSSASPSLSSSGSISQSQTATTSVSLTPSISESSSATKSAGASESPSASVSESGSSTASISMSGTSSVSVSVSPSLSATQSSSLSSTQSPSLSPSLSASSSISDTSSVTPTISESATTSMSAGSSMSPSPSISDSATESVSPSAAASVSLTPSVSDSASASVSVGMSSAASSSTSESSTTSMTASVTETASATPGETPTPSETPSEPLACACSCASLSCCGVVTDDIVQACLGVGSGGGNNVASSKSSNLTHSDSIAIFVCVGVGGFMVGIVIMYVFQRNRRNPSHHRPLPSPSASMASFNQHVIPPPTPARETTITVASPAAVPAPSKVKSEGGARYGNVPTETDEKLGSGSDHSKVSKGSKASKGSYKPQPTITTQPSPTAVDIGQDRGTTSLLEATAPPGGPRKPNSQVKSPMSPFLPQTVHVTLNKSPTPAGTSVLQGNRSAPWLTAPTTANVDFGDEDTSDDDDDGDEVFRM